MMRMQPAMIASLPLWLAGLLICGGAVLGAMWIELVVRQLVSAETRAAHHDFAAPMLGVVGTTYAVLLAFVAMLAWNGFNQAQSVTDSEASLLLNVYEMADGLATADKVTMRGDVIAYSHAVIDREWPAQAAGRPVVENEPNLSNLFQAALHLHPRSLGDANLHRSLLEDLAALRRARGERLLIQRSPLPRLIWLVLMAGGAISMAFSSFLGAPSLRMHLAMSSLLALSGALVLLLILALSNPFRGDLRVSDDPFRRVLVEMAP